MLITLVSLANAIASSFSTNKMDNNDDLQITLTDSIGKIFERICHVMQRKAPALVSGIKQLQRWFLHIDDGEFEPY